MMEYKGNLHTCLVNLVQKTTSAQKTKNKINNFLSSPLPNKEDWKYTKLKWAANSISNNLIAEKNINNILNWIPEKLFGSRIVVYNGQVVLPLSSFPTEINLVKLDNLEDEGLNLSQDKMHFRDSYFTKLNSALSSGFLLEVSKGAQIESPLEIIYAYDSDDPALCQSRTTVLLNEGSSVTLLTRTCFKNNNINLSNSVFEASVQRNASLTKYNIDNDNYTSPHNQIINNVFIEQEQQSKATLYDFSLSRQLVRNNITVCLRGEFATSQLYSTSLLRNNAHVDNAIMVNHFSPNCNSEQIYKGVYDDFSTGVFNGGVYVDKCAQKTDAAQQNNNILLSDNATIHAKPQLEIFADDVACAHGCTIGQIDKASLFYIQSRGISEKSAYVMLLLAFFNDVVSKIDNMRIKNHITSHLNNLLNR